MNAKTFSGIGLCALLAAACSADKVTSGARPVTGDSGSGGASGAGGNGGQGGGGGKSSGGTGDAGLAGADLKWKVLPASDPNSDAPPSGIAGVHVCVDEHPEIACADSDADGFFTLKHLPQTSDVVLELTKDGYIPQLVAIETSDIDMNAVQNPVQMTPTGADLSATLGFTVDGTNLGAIGFFVLGAVGSGFGPLPGSTATLTPDGAKGPFYYHADGQYDPALKKTESYGGAYLNVPEGNYKLTFTPPPGYDCAGISFPFAGWGFPVANEPAVTFPVKKGHLTGGVGNFCTPNGNPISTDGGSHTDASTGPVDGGPGGAKDGG
ncbi:MAG TPA: hypothetical protein VHE30_04255 [Polyangiaceae bacterium]|nr:hypothetical protein [Polyangiaceae bacterium]